MTQITLNLTTLLVAAAIMTGCSESTERKVAVFPVDGQLLAGGRPAAGAIVTFHATASDGAVSAKTAVVRPDGHFVAIQPDGAVGLPEGTYALTATWPENEKDRFDGKYADRAKPIATITVKPSINLLPPIQLP